MSGKTGLRSSRGGQFPNSQPPTHPSSLALLLISIRQIPTVACPQSPPSEPPIPSSLPLEPQQPVPTLAQPRQQRQRAEASLGGDHPTPSRTARKPHLPRASSARAGSLPRSPPSDPLIPSSLSLEPLKQPVPKAPPATTWRAQLNTGFLDARERVRFPQSFGTNPEHVHEQHR